MIKSCQIYNLNPPCKLIFIINTQVSFIHELNFRRNPPAVLPRFSLGSSLLRSSPNINPTNLIIFTPAQKFNQFRALRIRETSFNTLQPIYQQFDLTKI